MSIFLPSVLNGAADRLTAGPDRSFTDPNAWAQANLEGWNPAFYQTSSLTTLAEERKESVVGPHGLGKTVIDSAALLWFADTRNRAGIDWKVVTTAGVWRQLQRYLWPEIHKWAGRMKNPFPRNALLTTELKLRYGQAFPVASDDPANIEGAHADEILYIIDEAKSVPPNTWDAIEGAFSAGNAYCLASSTPGKAEGRLYEIHAKRPGLEDWKAVHVTLADAIAAGRIKPAWAEQRAKQWGDKSALYMNRVLGEFSTVDSDGVIPLSWLEAAWERWIALAEAGKLEADPLTAVSADVASEEGVDQTIIMSRYGKVLARVRREPHKDTMKTVGFIKEILDADERKGRKRVRPPIAVPDAIGVGTGVVDRLREQGVHVDAYMGSSGSDKHDKTGELSFLNRRAEAWWGMSDLLNPVFGENIALPPPEWDDQDVAPTLAGDLTAPKWEETSTGKIKIEDKEEIKKRLGRSPDEGDACVMNYNARLDFSADLIAPVGTTRVSKWHQRREYELA